MRFLDKFVEIIASITFAISTSFVCINVVNRYLVLGAMRDLAKTWQDFHPVYFFFRDIFGSISVTADEIPGLLLVWIAFLGAYLTMRTRGHIAFDLLIEKIKNQHLKNVLSLVSDFLIGGFLVVLLWQSIRMILISGATETETMEIAQGWFMLILPLASLLLLCVLANQWLLRLRNSKQ